MKTIISTVDSDKFLFKINIYTERERFSITADGKDRCGCLHEEILQYRPDLKCFVDLHLSDIDGQPMHPEENGWYWLAKAAGIPQRYEPEQTKERCLEYFAQHCRISNLEAAIIIGQIQEKEFPRDEWQKIMSGMRPRWKKEAENALALLETLA